MLSAYYRLAKPGIVYGNAITAAAGFFLASKRHIDIGLLLAMLAGLSLIIASACVFNNYIDRDIDKKMNRTKKRALASGGISIRSALTYASLLGLFGSLILGLFTNWLALGIALAGLFAYVVVYGVAKRRTVHGTVIGSISGAMPPVVGYAAVTNHLDGAALLLFIILVCWQMPHFYAIAMYRYKDYKAADLPVLPVKKGMAATKRQIIAYIVAFTASASLLSVFGYTGYTYRIVVIVLGIYWLYKGLAGYSTTDDAAWGRRMFFASLIVTLGLSLMIAVGARLP